MKKRYHVPSQRRFLSRDGKARLAVVRRSGKQYPWSDLYHLLLTLPWPLLLTLIAATYLVANVVFAFAYLAGGDCIENAQPGNFLDAFFFSVQTMASIGYGAMYPKTTYAHAVVTIEALVGLLGIAIGTGIMFARFSRPTARVLFSDVAVVGPYEGIPTLMFRAANQRNNQIVEAQVRMTLVRNEVTAEGQFMRRFYDLKLIRGQTPIFALTWMIMHQIDETSPLYGMTAESLAEVEGEIVVTMTGLDGTVSQTVHARHSYIAREIMWNTRFVDILSLTADGQRSIDYTHFHQVIPL